MIMGAAFGAVVSSSAKDVFTPLIATIVGEPDFSGLAVRVGDSAILYGSFLNALIAFVFVAGAVFFFSREALNVMLERMNPNQETAPKPSAEDVELLPEIGDLLKSRS